MVIAGIIGLKTVRNPPTKPKLVTHFYTVSDDSDRDPTGVPTLGFNTLLIFYNWITALTILASLVFDLGKLWSVIGVLHNTAEIIILVLLGNGGRIRNSNFFAWILTYILSVVSICIFADWPVDAAFFKFQGLCMDFALVIEYIRIFITTKEHIRDAGRDTLPLNVDDDDNNDNNNDYRRSSPIWPTTIDHPNHIWLLIIAAGFHLIGNVLATFFIGDATPSLLFGLTYAVTFPLYVYFAYLDTNAASVLPQKRIYLPSTPAWKVTVISILSITLSALTLRIGASL